MKIDTKNDAEKRLQKYQQIIKNEDIKTQVNLFSMFVIWSNFFQLEQGKTYHVFERVGA